VKDWAHIQNACELFGQKKIPIIWGPLRHGPGRAALFSGLDSLFLKIGHSN
jgi:hypothetical protein